MAFIETFLIKKTYYLLFMRKIMLTQILTEEASSWDLSEKMLSKFNVNLT